MSYTSVFGGTTIYPSDVSYLALALSADNPLEWPLESSGAEDPAARIIDVTPTASGYSIVLPDATQTGAGQTILFNNLSGSHSFFVKNFAGATIATVDFGQQWQVYLADTATAAGTWRVFRYGASTATVQPSALAGSGLVVTGNTLSQSAPVTSFSTSGLTLAPSNRAAVFVWTGTGAGTLNLPASASVGNNFFVEVRNSGGGDLTLDPAGTETINDAPTLAFRPGDSATVISDGAEWYTVGFGQDAVFAFDYTSITVTGGNYTLNGSELNRIAYKFVGALTSDVYIIIPATVQQYWITNATTGAFNFFVRVAGSPPTQVDQGAKGIYYCDGANVILASDAQGISFPLTVSQGGTGAVTASAARLNLGITPFADPIVTATSGSAVRATIGAAASGANSDITSLAGLTTALSVAQGGTGLTTGTSGGVLFFSGAATVASSSLLTANALVVGGGAGAAPSTVTTGTGVVTALGVNVGSAGAFVTNNAANTFTAAQTISGTSALFLGDATAYSMGLTPKVQLSSTSGGASTINAITWSATAAPQYAFGRSRGATAGTYTAVQADDDLGVISFYGTDGTILDRGAYIAGIADGTPASTFVPARIAFYTGTNTTNPSERMRIDSTGNVLVTGSGGLGYGAGSGGAVTQLTSRVTGVTLNRTNGAITLVSAAGTTAWQSFTVTNSRVDATDTVIVSQKSGTDLYQIFVTAVGAGSFRISFATTGGTTTEQPVFNFAVIKAVVA